MFNFQKFIYRKNYKKVTTNIGCGYIAIVENKNDNVSITIKKESQDVDEQTRDCEKN